MNLLLQRYSDNGNSTLGMLFQVATPKPVFKCYTLEDEHRDIKLKGQTRIPAGKYQVKLRREVTNLTKKYQEKYPWFKFHLEICNIPNFTGVYIHIGNNDGHTDGCLLVGDATVNNMIRPGVISESTNAFQRLYIELVKYLESGKTITLTIQDEASLL